MRNLFDCLTLYTNQFSQTGKVYVEKTPLAIHIYATNHPDAKPCLSLYSPKSDCQWKGYSIHSGADDNPISDAGVYKSEIDHQIGTFIGFYGYEIN